MNITGGIFKGSKIAAPDRNTVRPTLSKVRMSVFNTLQAMLIFEEASFLDMFSGSGIMALEALSRGFSNVIAIEKHPIAIRIIKSNFKKFENTPKLLLGDSLKITPKLTQKFDVIYIDPPYCSGIYEKSLEAVKHIAGGIVILEHVEDVNCSGWNIIKQKKYGSKQITFITN